MMPAAKSQEEEAAMHFESATIRDIMKAKGMKESGSWLSCSTSDTVFDAVKSVS